MEKKMLVINLLKNEIGHNWREFARFLSIQEAMIDSLSIEYSDSPQSIIPELLKIFEDSTASSMWQIKLTTALEKCRRNVLKNKVNEIMCT